MTDGDMEVWTVGQDWTGWPTDLVQAAVAVIAKTRQEWVSRGYASASPGGSSVNGTRYADALFRFAADAKNRRPARPRVRLRSTS